MTDTPMYVEVTKETIERLWPETKSRPVAAWKHLPCGLILVNRADHDDLNSVYRCPEAGRRG